MLPHFASLLVVVLAPFPAPAAAAAAAPAARVAPAEATAPVTTVDTAVFAGGCFWGIEAVFEHVKGVISSESGYAGGTREYPTYEAVSSGLTGHAEAVRVTFDTAQVSYAELLRVFFSVAHDPTQLNRQGPDHGTQYRSAIFCATAEQLHAATTTIDSLTKAGAYRRAIVTQLNPLTAFYPAEAYHQDYLVRHPTEPYIVFHDMPKLRALAKELPELYREARSRN
jgi:peptide-methionine (S)-S-oxide reductase